MIYVKKTLFNSLLFWTVEGVWPNRIREELPEPDLGKEVPYGLPFWGRSRVGTKKQPKTPQK